MTDKQLLKKVRGNRLRRFREYMGETLEKFAEVLNLHTFWYMEYERGLFDLTPEMQEKLKCAYLLNTEWYKDGEGELCLNEKPEGGKKGDQTSQRIKRDDIIRYVGNHPGLMIAIDEMVRFYQNHVVDGEACEGEVYPVFRYDFTQESGDESVWHDYQRQPGAPV